MSLQAYVSPMAAGMVFGLWCAAAGAQDSGGGSDKKAADTQDTPAKAQTDEQEAGKTRRPSPEAVMQAFQDQRPTNAPVQSRKSHVPMLPDETGSGSGSLLREGQYINGEAGRLERDGPWWSFVFESDSPETPRPPMRLLPNQKLENMTRAVEASTESIVFELSGEVTLFASENYLLVRKSLRRRSPDNLLK